MRDLNCTLTRFKYILASFDFMMSCLPASMKGDVVKPFACLLNTN